MSLLRRILVRRTYSRRTCVALGLLLGACGGATSQAGTETTVARGLEPCPSTGEVRLGRICWNPLGSRWHVTAMAPGGEYAFDVELLPLNRARATDHPAAGPATDEWFVDGNTLRIFLANRFVEYRADLTNGTVMVGQAQNVRGDAWEWRGDRMTTSGGCQADEATLGELCFAVAGTRWTLHEGGQSRVIHFAPEGRVLLDQGGSEHDTWSQEGSTLRFTIDGREHTAEIRSASRQLSGEGWEAEHLELHPPPMH